MGSGSNEKDDEGKEKYQKWKLNMRYLSRQDWIPVLFNLTLQRIKTINNVSKI